MKVNLMIMFFIVGLPLLGYAQEPTQDELKERTVIEMRKKHPQVYTDANLWRINIVPESYKKTTDVEKWEWTIEGDPNEKGEYYEYKFLFENKTDSLPKVTPNISLGANMNTKMSLEKIKEGELIIIKALKDYDANISSVENIKIIKQYPEPLGSGIIYRFNARLIYTNKTYKDIEGSFVKEESNDQIAWLYKKLV
jgi:hypothetical protein